MSNSGYNPSLATPSSTSKKQMKSNDVYFAFGGNQVQSALGFTPIIPKVVTKPIQIKR